eukprot:scaffold6082_cov62-Attheya_sp.AAC.8
MDTISTYPTTCFFVLFCVGNFVVLLLWWHHRKIFHVSGINNSYPKTTTIEEYSTECVPDCTQMQRDLLLRELDSFITEVADDNELISILKEYYEDIETNTPIDKPWENKQSRARNDSIYTT